jgi:glycosyltransferase involved in cell wall biosynthesis
LKFPFRTPPDIVHVHSSHAVSFYRASFYVLFARYVWRRPVVLHIHGSSFHTFVRDASTPVRLYQELVFGASDEVIVLSEYWRDVVSERVPRSKISIVPNAVDPALYDPKYHADPPRIVFVSNLVPRKGVVELVSALRDVLTESDVDCVVDIAGDGRLREHVEELADEFEEVTYHGYVSEAKKRALLNEGTVFVLPTYAEGLPIAILEAMAGGNAIASTQVAAIPEVVGEDRGRLVEPGDVEALAEALHELVSEPDRAADMGKRNRAIVEQQYSWDHIVDRLVDIYDNNVETAT